MAILVYLFDCMTLLSRSFLSRITAVARCGLLYRRNSVVCLSVCLSVTKAVEPSERIEMAFGFGMCTQVGPMNHILDGSRSPLAKRQFWGWKGDGQDKPGHVRWSIYPKRLSRGQRQYSADADWDVLDVVHIGATWRIRLDRPCEAAIWRHVKILWPLLLCLFFLPNSVSWP